MPRPTHRNQGLTELLFQLSRGIMRWFVPPDLRTVPEESRRARLVVVSGLAMAALCAVLLFFVPWNPAAPEGAYGLPSPVVAGLALSVVVFWSTAYVVRRTASARSASLLLAASLAVMVSFLAYFAGGFTSPVLWWLVAIPLFSALVSGPRGALNAAILTGGLFLFFYLLYVQDHPFPGHGTGQDAGVRQLRGQLTLLAFLTILGWYYERDRLGHMRHLTDAYARIEATNRALQYSQEHVRQIAENIGQALWMYDVASERVVYANSGFEDLWSMDRQRLADNPRAWVGRVHPEDLDMMPTSADGHDHVYRIVADNGEEKWIRHSVYPVRASGDVVERLIHIAADITIKQTADSLRERFLETVLEVQETERKHLARELHDETGQSLTALLVGLRALDGTLEDAAQRDHVKMLRQQLRTVINDIGRLSRGLHPQVLDELGLSAAVTRLAHDVSDHHGIEVNIRTAGDDDEDRIPADARLTVYRIAQEALTNVIRHAHAKQVDVSLTVDDDSVYLQVEDDGRGFTPKKPRSSKRHEIGMGLGLMSMRERAALQGGTVSIESQPGLGTTVLAEIPLFPRMTTAEVRRESI